MALTEDDIQPQMTRRRPGQSALTTPRNEKDRLEIQSGAEFGFTLGTPIGMIVRNDDRDLRTTVEAQWICTLDRATPTTPTLRNTEKRLQRSGDYR